MLREVFRTENELTMAVSGTGSAGMEAVRRQPDRAGRRDARLRQRRLRRAAWPTSPQRAGGRRCTASNAAWGEVDRSAEGGRRASSSIRSPRSSASSTPKPPPAPAADRRDRQARPRRRRAAAGRCRHVARRVPVEIDDWEIDACYSGTQKCLSCPPGLSPVSFCPRAVDADRQPQDEGAELVPRLQMLRQYWGDDRFYHHTAPINMTYALHEALGHRARGRLGQPHRPPPQESRKRCAPASRRSASTTSPKQSLTDAQRRAHPRRRRRRRRPQSACSNATASRSAAASAPSKARPGASD